MPRTELPAPSVVVGAIVFATISTVFPGFVIGAMSVQVSAEFAVSEGTYGWGLGSFFLAATAGSVVFGRLAQLIGPRRQIMGVLSLSAVVQLALAAFASTFGAVIAALAVCGLANAANQTAINLALTEARLPRLGLSIAIKQSSMPGAALLSGLAVPLVALTVGWRWAYVFGAILAMTALVIVARVLPRETDRRVATQASRPQSRSGALVQAAVGAGFLAFCAGALSAWVVGSGVDAGLDEGLAGAMLSLGAACGIALRLWWGFRLDSLRTAPLRMAGYMVLIGGVGFALLAIRSPVWHIGATAIAFGAGWVWPIFTNYGIVRANRSAAAAATGITQMGVYIGVFIAPLVTGWIIEVAGYGAMWSVVAASAAVGAAVTIRVSPDF